jgi:hypothetical protein
MTSPLRSKLNTLSPDEFDGGAIYRTDAGPDSNLREIPARDVFCDEPDVKAAAPITHQAIVDRMAALEVELGEQIVALRLRNLKERKSLQELCSGLGHVFGPEDRNLGSMWPRVCVVCRKAKAA